MEGLLSTGPTPSSLVYRSVGFSQRYSAVKAARKHRELDAVVRRGRSGGSMARRIVGSSGSVRDSSVVEAY